VCVSVCVSVCDRQCSVGHALWAVLYSEVARLACVGCGYISPSVRALTLVGGSVTGARS